MQGDTDSSAASECCEVHKLGKCDAVFTCCDKCPTFFGKPGTAAQTCLAPHPILAECVGGPRMRCERLTGHDGRHERYFTSSQTVIWEGNDERTVTVGSDGAE